jgi:hypothetical protein
MHAQYWVIYKDFDGRRAKPFLTAEKAQAWIDRNKGLKVIALAHTVNIDKIKGFDGQEWD